jgi:hypothetical protein
MTPESGGVQAIFAIKGKSANLQRRLAQYWQLTQIIQLRVAERPWDHHDRAGQCPGIDAGKVRYQRPWRALGR